MPQPTFSDIQEELERRSRDLTTDIELLMDWPLMKWDSILALIQHIGVSLKTMSAIADRFETETRRVMATGAHDETSPSKEQPS